MLVARRPDSDFYRTFFNSVTRDLFGTVGVNPELEFCATSVGRASGAVPIRVYRIGGSLPAAVREIIADLPFGAAIHDQDAAVHRISARDRPLFRHRAAKRRARIRRTDRAGVLPRLARLRRRPPHRRQLHHAPGGGVQQLAARRASRRRHAVARRGRLAVRLRPLLFPCGFAGGQRRHHAAALLHAAQAHRRVVHRAWAAPSRARRSATLPCIAISTPPSTASCTPRATAVWS